MASPSASLRPNQAWQQHVQVSDELNLATVRGSIEGRFLEAGDVLVAAVEGISALVEALTRLSDGPTVEALTAVTEDISKSAVDLLELSSAHDARDLRISALAQSASALEGCMAAMQSNLAYLRIYALNIKITSGGILEAGPQFITFGQEIADRIQRGREQLDAFGQNLGSLKSTLNTSQALEDELGRLCLEILPSVPDSLLSNARALSDHHARVASLASEVSVAARDIQTKVGRTLGGLQIGDITRQRIEHVERGLQELEQGPALLALPDEQQGRIRNAVRYLLQAQLEATTQDFHAEATLVCDTMKAISRDASAILRLKDVAVGGADAKSQNVLGDLADNVDRALNVVARTEMGVRAAEDVSRSAVQAARALRGRIGELQAMRADVQMMALNTSLRCGRIGESGRPLNVIALELRHHADFLEESAILTTTALEALAEHADEANEACNTDDQPEATAARLSDAVDRIRAASSGLDAQVETVAGQGNAVVKGLNAALHRLDFQRDLGATLDRALDSLAQSIEPLDKGYDGSDRAVLAPIMARLGASYTMAQERVVHQSVLAELGLNDLEIARPEALPSSASNFDDGLF